jgi:acyl-CoA synthetase (AMP-forming)/AMP-acid ligase II
MNLTPPEFNTLPALIREHGRAAAQRPALTVGSHNVSYGELNRQMDAVASALYRHGVQPGESICVCAGTSIEYASVFLGAIRAGVVVAPLAPSSTPESLARMVKDAGARLVFTDAGCAPLLDEVRGVAIVSLDGPAFAAWLQGESLSPEAIDAHAGITPESAFNIIYSSGTTGEPKGIVQSHGMRWAHIQRGNVYGYGTDTVTLLSTPLYSNTTLVVFVPTLAFGGTLVLMTKFEALAYLQLAQMQRVTHTMLVPVQYQRLMARPDFNRFDLSSFKIKFCTSAPFAASLKADVLKRWPGGLVEFYGMTEGGGSCILDAHLHPDKLHTVGRPSLNHDIRLIDDEGRVVGVPGQGATEAGEVVGHSASMMTGYHGRPEKTREAEWFDSTGKRFIRTGDIGRFDADGFLILFDRKKDMIISGGFNIYPSDMEAIVRGHPDVADVAVVGVPSVQWGETPVAFVVRKPGAGLEPGALMDWVNAKVGKTQRLASLRWIDELPRSAIGKVLKRELREQFGRDIADTV